MGWVYQHRDKGITHKDWFAREFEGNGYEVLDVASGSFHRDHIFMAVRHPKGYVFALICLTMWVPRDYYNFGYKDMGETMGPGISDCPERIFKLLTPLEEIYPDADFEADRGFRWAKKWRERVQEHLERMKNRIPLTDGLAVRCPYHLHFGSWTLKADTTFLVKNAKRRIFQTIAGGVGIRLRRSTLYDLQLA